MRLRLICLFFAVAAVAACSPSTDVIGEGPRLISEVTLPPVTFPPTRILSPTPSPRATERLIEPTEVSLVITPTEADFELITPTIPPSKTPTVTPTITPTQQILPTLPPTQVPPTSIPVLVPTIVIDQSPDIINGIAPDTDNPSPLGQISAPAAGGADPGTGPCDKTDWLIAIPGVRDCPGGSSQGGRQTAPVQGGGGSAPVQSAGAYQNFEFGHMFWVQSQDAIYVLFDDTTQPRWGVYQDRFEAGMPEKDPNIDAQAPPYADFQPRNGFGLVWREVPGIRDRIGWAESEYEASYTITVRLGDNGVIYISEPGGRVFALYPDYSDWELYAR